MALLSSLNPTGIQEKIAPHCIVNQSIGQSIPSAVLTVINFSGILSDPYGLVTTGAGWKFTAPINGLYLVNCACILDTNTVSAGQEFSLRLGKNGSQQQILDSNYQDAAGSGYVGAGASALVTLLKNDYLQIYAWQTNVAARPLLANAVGNNLSITRIGRLS